VNEVDVIQAIHDKPAGFVVVDDLCTKDGGSSLGGGAVGVVILDAPKRADLDSPTARRAVLKKAGEWMRKPGIKQGSPSIFLVDPEGRPIRSFTKVAGTRFRAKYEVMEGP
jgi:hypothetical protein